MKSRSWTTSWVTACSKAGDRLDDLGACTPVAREEHDKEDLLREAIALVERVEWEVEAFPDSIVAGFRRSGAVSFFLGADPVFQFNENDQLRRAYVDGKLIKADRGNLASLNRVRAENQVQLRRTDLTPEATADLLSRIDAGLDMLQSQLETDAYEVVGEVPPTADVTDRVLSWLRNRPQPIEIAGRPNV